jgi:hypothetical protein
VCVYLRLFYLLTCDPVFCLSRNRNSRFIFLISDCILELYTSSEESGAEDSDEDIITDYLSPLDDNGNLDAGASAATSSSSPGATVAAINVAAISTRFYSTESPPSLRISAAEDMEPAGAATDGGGTDDRMISNYATAAAAAESIPIISVTQHSPAASKAFFILGEISIPLLVKKGVMI